MERIFDKQEGYAPFLYYVIFGIQPEDITIQKHIDDVLEIPETLEFAAFSRHNEEQAAYMNNFTSNALGGLLEKQDAQLFAQVKACTNCVVVSGNIQQDHTLAYLHNTIRIVKAAAKKGIAVLDLLTLQWYTIEQWQQFSSNEFNVYDHVQVFVSQEGDGVWLHTRGMLKYGRPDISITKIPKPKTHEMKLLVDQMIYYEAMGAMLLQPAKFKTSMGCYEVHLIFYNDFENYDFNNAFIEVAYPTILYTKDMKE